MNRRWIDHPRRSKPVVEWPARDQAAWHMALKPGNILDGAGPGAHWATATRRLHENAYGCWLQFCDRFGTLDQDASPADRIVPERVEAFIADLRTRGASSTVWNRVRYLYGAIAAMAPNEDWCWLLQAATRLYRVIKPARNVNARIKPARELFEAGIRLMEEAPQRVRDRRSHESAIFRDGLTIALLAFTQVRIKNLASIEIDRHLLRHNGGYRLQFAAQEVKNRKATDIELVEALVPYVDRYLDHHRPKLLRGNCSNRLWISAKGRPMPQYTVMERIRSVTKREFGHVISPHLFRKCAATSIAIEVPEYVHIIPSILGHRSFKTGETYYNMAKGLEANRQYQAQLRRLRRNLRSPKARPPSP